ncbi:MAG: DUF4837 family protein [Flavobacteriaceae bacterium]|nr:DUF4837 family protein [Flavobacteriaceae bacterium]
MKKTLSLLFIIFLFLGCNNDGKKARTLSASSGNINDVSVVVDNLLWQDSVGEAIRDVLASPVEGLSIDEPLFSLRQMPPQVFSDFTTKNRTIFIVKKGEEPRTTIKNNVYAKPQTVVLVTGQTNDEIIDQLNSNKNEIVEAFKKAELKEKQRRIRKSLHETEPIENALGITLDFPTAYRIAVNDEEFFWIRKDINSGTMDMMIYEVPLSTIRPGDSAVVDIIKMRDSIGQKYIEGPVEGSYMITEKAYAPYKFNEELDGKPTIITKGLWDVKNYFMSGPFVNYAIRDEANNRYLIAEGYVFAPSVDKRDNMFELEAIIKSLEFN